MQVEKKSRFDSRVSSYVFNRDTDFVGKGEMGTAVRAFKHGNLQMPVVLKIIRQAKLSADPKLNKWMRREIAVHRELSKKQ